MDQPITINNAGLVLCNPFIPHYFSLTGLTDENNNFKDSDSQKRATILLQHLLGIDATNASQEGLTLNKLMCGLNPDIQIDCTLSVTEQETKIGQQMLNMIIQHWNCTSQMSTTTLIESFLIRQGTLLQQSEDTCWELQVEKKGYDILLDRLPWDYSTIKYAWMKTAAYVKWL